MAARLTVLFYIILCLEAGGFLTVLPWVGGGSYWGDNYFLLLTAAKKSAVGLQHTGPTHTRPPPAPRRRAPAPRPPPPFTPVQTSTPQSLPSNEAHEDAARATQ